MAALLSFLPEKEGDLILDGGTRCRQSGQNDISAVCHRGNTRLWSVHHISLILVRSQILLMMLTRPHYSYETWSWVSNPACTPAACILKKEESWLEVGKGLWLRRAMQNNIHETLAHKNKTQHCFVQWQTKWTNSEKIIVGDHLKVLIFSSHVTETTFAVNEAEPAKCRCHLDDVEAGIFMWSFEGRSSTLLF